MIKEDKKAFEVVEVSTKSETRIKDNETNETYTKEEAICKILNDIREIKKSVV